jgi:hypothetical protein
VLIEAGEPPGQSNGSLSRLSIIARQQPGDDARQPLGVSKPSPKGDLEQLKIVAAVQNHPLQQLTCHIVVHGWFGEGVEDPVDLVPGESNLKRRRTSREGSDQRPELQGKLVSFRERPPKEWLDESAPPCLSLDRVTYQ